MNPTKIQWQPWSKEAFQTAKSLDKPILLDISATWCHWCHVMDQTTYSDPDVATLIMKSCVPIKVDKDQRPDIDKRYNMGGWPTTAFLTPNGKIITGGTYIPPQQMKELITEVLEYYKTNKQKIEEEAEEPERKRPKLKSMLKRSRKKISNLSLITLRSRFPKALTKHGEALDLHRSFLTLKP